MGGFSKRVHKIVPSYPWFHFLWFHAELEFQLPAVSWGLEILNGKSQK